MRIDHFAAFIAQHEEAAFRSRQPDDGIHHDLQNFIHFQRGVDDLPNPCQSLQMAVLLFEWNQQLADTLPANFPGFLVPRLPRERFGIQRVAQFGALLGDSNHLIVDGDGLDLGCIHEGFLCSPKAWIRK